MNSNERIILGIDPGTNILGFGIICISNKKTKLIHYGVLKMTNKDTHELRLKKIFDFLLELITKYLPDELAIEAPFFGKNVQSMLKLGRAQGVAMAAGLSRNIPIFEYSPRKIKQSITGKGSASKEQVAAMIENLVLTKIDCKYLDATDGIAVALCHYYQGNSINNEKSYSGWKSFLSDNPDRIS